MKRKKNQSSLICLKKKKEKRPFVVLEDNRALSDSGDEIFREEIGHSLHRD